MLEVMVAVDSEAYCEKGPDVDLEIGPNTIVAEQEELCGDVSSVGKARNHLPRVWNGFGRLRNGDEASSLGETGFGAEENMGLLENKAGSERLKEKKSQRKPSKPPRPPKPCSLDAADQKMVREMSELAMLKRARIGRMKALRKVKNEKAASNGSNLCALLVTIVFCFIIIWHGVFSKGSSGIGTQASPQPSLSQD
ncbi:hypothetical protein AXF42_Ash002921 [Apostasia shenzhenica]|uniref:Uncharacterized protein n=1 Tax=Apostasia shenzhenica TaxID=1088818 RepID=A0A2I0A7Q5_9ASPA|nr:hypothetical protein AXF42_Ash002921 [Apostasia shenzhenica]